MWAASSQMRAATCPCASPLNLSGTSITTIQYSTHMFWWRGACQLVPGPVNPHIVRAVPDVSVNDLAAGLSSAAVEPDPAALVAHAHEELSLPDRVVESDVRVAPCPLEPASRPAALRRAAVG